MQDIVRKSKRGDRNLADRIKNHEWRLFKKRRIRKLANPDFTIIASNCVGTIIYHDLGVPFLSPTINLTIGILLKKASGNGRKEKSGLIGIICSLLVRNGMNALMKL